MDAGDRARAIIVLARGDTEVVVGRVAIDCTVDLALVDALARLQLGARRDGCALRLRVLCPELLRLLFFVGLTDLVDGPPSVLEPRREAEGGEELWVQEVVEPGDPPT